MTYLVLAGVALLCCTVILTLIAWFERDGRPLPPTGEKK